MENTGNPTHAVISFSEKLHFHLPHLGVHKAPENSETKWQ